MATELETMAAGDDDDILPCEIWRDILHRLPVKSILRCRSVRKSWYSLISCPNFISDYSNNKKDNRVLLRRWDLLRSENRSFSCFDESFTESCEHDYFPDTLIRANIVGSCNGLICFYTNKGVSATVRRIIFLIWNPAIRKIVELPSPTDGVLRSPYIGFGFGFDPKTNDHKVLCVAYANVFEIFDLNKGVWRGITPIVHSCRFWSSYPDCYVNGAVYWTAYKQRNAMSSDIVILSFDMIQERFREISMPNCAEFRIKGPRARGVDNDAAYQGMTFNGLLYMMVWKSQYYDMSRSCSFWEMKECGLTESWTKVYNIDLSSEFYPGYFRLWDNDKVLMVHNLRVDKKNPVGKKKQSVVLYNTGSREYKCLFTSTKLIMNLRMYKESLFLMGRNG